MEVGRSAATGDGDLFMETEGSTVAFNMNEEIKFAVKNSSNIKEDIGPKQRMRSSSANEASKPISVLQRRHTGQKIHSFSPLGKNYAYAYHKLKGNIKIRLFSLCITHIKKFNNLICSY